MELLRRARELEAQGRDIVHMEIGEPDFTTAAPVVEAGVRALRKGYTHYLPAVGLPALREAIAEHYADRYGARIDPRRIFITPGASGALLLAMALVVNPGEEVLVADPGYPCNRNFIELVNGVPRGLPVSAVDGYQLTAEAVASAWGERTAAVLIGSPDNPTGVLASAARLQDLDAEVRRRQGMLIVDEIYHGLHYVADPASAVRHCRQALIINSFSKYYGMTGWRLGWLVAPCGYEAAVEKLLQNFFINASTPAQYAALACFTVQAREIFEQRRTAFRQRRDFLAPALCELGFRLPIVPDGAFYLYADCSALAADSNDLARLLLEEAGVAVTPGLDFERTAPHRHLRFAYTTSLPRLQEGVRRIAGYLGR
ncbi:Aspartate/tyrosine/aromatic aminotransferase [Nitrococcus mobilis Nb-231]|uniref:Aminotransferase n=2 Tax=Nitrococcus mobilis TaxID=35797 RepID=A4BM25_9GAMM|nr:Aspartate/tyrosine/aromatic aminotransferase [Nitrococcus mobilis Nb-231]